jgi:hypothetical protein
MDCQDSVSGAEQVAAKDAVATEDCCGRWFMAEANHHSQRNSCRIKKKLWHLENRIAFDVAEPCSTTSHR